MMVAGLRKACVAIGALAGAKIKDFGCAVVCVGDLARSAWKSCNNDAVA
jgi:hypothetical protein